MSDFPTVTYHWLPEQRGYSEARWSANKPATHRHTCNDKCWDGLLIPVDKVRATWDVDEAAKAFVLFYDEVREIAPSAVVLVVEVPDAE